MTSTSSMYIPNTEADKTKIFQGDIFQPVVPLIYVPEIQEMGCNIIRRNDNSDPIVYAEETLRKNGEVVWENDEDIIVKARKKRIIIISQTCDIFEEGLRTLKLRTQEQFSNPFIVYAPVYKISEIRMNEQRIGEIRKYKILSAFYLEEDKEIGIEESVVFFNHLSSIIKSRDSRFETFGLDNRIGSLRSPWREKLGDMVGNYFSRVALPSEVTFI